MITMREARIANKILTVKRNIRIKDLAEEFDVSSRSIQYDLENVKTFLKDNGIELHSSSSKGMWLECEDAQREQCLHVLSQLQNRDVFYTQEIRTQKIILELVFEGRYISASELANHLSVSRGTILGDMDYVAMQLEESGITLSRKSRLGYRIEGSELAIRTLTETILQENLSVYTTCQIINHLKQGEPDDEFKPPFPNVEKDEYLLIEKQLIDAFQTHTDEMQTENIVLMLTRLIISVKRLQKGFLIGDDEEYNQRPDESYLYPYWCTIYLQNDLPVLCDELLYLEGNTRQDEFPVDIVALSATLIESLSALEKYPYYNDATLYPRLLSHLQLSFANDHNNVESNPFNNVIIKNHKELFDHIRSICQSFAEGVILFSNDSFISYLALHFLAARRNLGIGKKKRALFVCATGRGAAKMIERMLESEIGDVQIMGHCSLMEVDASIKEVRPDIIISVFPIVCTTPVIVVEPLPTKENIEAIRRVLQEMDEDDAALYKKAPFSYQIPWDKPEEASQEVILIGLKIYKALLDLDEFCVREETQFPFLAHVMLLANRYYFGTQYGGDKDAPSNMERRIQKELQDVDIFIGYGEIRALMFYTT